MKSIFTFIAIIIFVLPAVSAFADTLLSNGTGGGSWDITSSWDNTNAPADMADGDTLVIQLGDTITIDNSVSFNGVIQIYGVLVFDKGKLTMDATSAIQLADGSDIIALSIGENDQIRIGGSSNKISADEINNLTTPNQLTDGSLTGGGCAVTLDCEDDPLPVEVIYFRAVEQSGSIKLEWATSFEENFDYFTLERSFDGRTFNNYVNIFSKTALSSVVKKYAYVDEMPYPGLSYYRLKATDFNGSVEYHGVVSANLDDVDPDILIYANPTISGQLTVSYNGVEEAGFRVLNITGQIIEKGTILPGLNNIKISPSLNSNIYFFQVEGSNTSIVKKFIIR